MLELRVLMLDALRLTVSPAGSVPIESATAELKLLAPAMVAVLLPLVPSAMLSVAGLSVSAKVGAGVTVNVTVVVLLTTVLLPLLVPEAVMVSV